ncbi:TPA: right-handed parallel beta-helix repeat-containing protein, partial [Klebsiella pneumoniae]
MAELNPPLGTTTPEIFMDNVKRADELVNGPAGTVDDRGGEPLDTWRQMMAKNDEVRQNLIPLSRQYMTLAAAQADIANIPDGSATYYRSPDDSALAIEVINNAGTLEATGRSMPSQEAINSVAEKEPSGGITRVTTLDNDVTLLQDELGKLFLPGMKGSVQDALQPIEKDRSPSIRRWNDCRGRSVEIIDELGEVHIPGMPSSIQRSFSQIARRVSYLEGKQVFIDAREFGFGRKNNMPLDNNRALQAAINFAANKPAGGTVFLPYDTVAKRGSITPKNNVSIIGYGMGKSVILQEGSESAFLLYQSGIYLDNCLFADFTIDGQQQTLPSTGYTPSVKGMYFQFFKRCFFHRLEITNTAATGMGIDYALDSSITDCI